MFKFLDPTGCTYHEARAFQYNLPQRGQTWGDWTEHPEPAEPDGNACGPGRLHLMKTMSARYAPANWWPWWAEGDVLVGEDREKASYWRVKLRRISPKAFARCLRPPFSWGKAADLRDADLRDADLRGANLRGADLRDANLGCANLGCANLGCANLRYANLRYANLEKTNLKKADLQRCHLRRVKNLTIKQLCEARTLYRAEMEVDLLERIRRDYPHLLEPPAPAKKISLDPRKPRI